jgi:hypothetical protein
MGKGGFQMIVSVSRRTDVPAYFSDWFFSRMEMGFVEVINPYNPRQIRHVSLLPDDVDGFVFWTKNPRPMLDRLRLLDGYRYYFLFTLNPYGNDIEVNLPPKQTVIDTFKELSGILGADRVVWRYDPVLLSDQANIDFHVCRFEKLAGELGGYTGKVIFSFIDRYKKNEEAFKNLRIQTPLNCQKLIIAEKFSAIARAAGLAIESCAEDIDLSPYGIAPASCIDAALLEYSGGKPVSRKKDANQRPFCRCHNSVDIGAYGSCRCGCVYCYAK